MPLEAAKCSLDLGPTAPHSTEEKLREISHCLVRLALGNVIKLKPKYEPYKKKKISSKGSFHRKGNFHQNGSFINYTFKKLQAFICTFMFNA